LYIAQHWKYFLGEVSEETIHYFYFFYFFIFVSCGLWMIQIIFTILLRKYFYMFFVDNSFSFIRRYNETYIVKMTYLMSNIMRPILDTFCCWEL
jgi:hypothetical protein